MRRVREKPRCIRGGPEGAAKTWVTALSVVALAACASAPAGPRRVPAPKVERDVLPGGALGASGYPVEVLEARARYVFSADGAQTHTETVRYRILSMDDLGPWAAVSATWSPWFQARPELSAKVTRLSGASFELDLQTASEAPVESGQRGLYTDRRRLEAPLPGLATGAIVERTVVVKDTQPFLRGGSLARFGFGASVPLASSVLEVEVPEGVPITYQLRGIDLEPAERREAGRVILTFEAKDVPALGPSRMLLPPEHPRHPHVLLSTVKSWRAVASTYSKLVEGQLEGADVSSLLTGLDRSRSARDLVRDLLVRLHSEIRYTGLELGEQALLPRRPEETLARRFGDCKDKGVLLIALLRAVGIDAHLALVRSGFGEDVVPEVPGVELFDHAIVYVPGEEPLWIDATQDLLPAGELPMSVQGRRALVVDPEGPGLVTVPEAPDEHNHYVEVRRVTFGDWGPVDVAERTEASGTMEHRLRRQLLGAGRSQVESSLSRYVERAYRAERIGDFRYGDARNVDVPFAVEVEAVGARIGYTARTSAKVQLRTPVLFGFVPDLLRDAALGATAGDDDRERQAAAMLVRTRLSDMVLPQPFVAEVRYHLVPPRGFEAKALPEPVDIPLGPGRYGFTVEPAEDGTLWATMSLRTGKRRYSAAEAQAFVAGLAEVWELPVPSVELVHSGARLMEAGKVRQAVAVYQGLVAAEPDYASHRARLAEALLEVGLGTAARAEAERAAAKAPSLAPVLMAYGHTLEHDPYGRLHAPGFDRAGALEVFRRVIALEPDHVGARLAEARLLEVDEAGRPSRRAEDWAAAADAYRSLRDRTGDTEFDGRLMLALYWGGDFEALHELASRLPPRGPTVAMQIVAAAKTRGVQAALRELEALELPKADRQEALETAATSLARVRAYEPARALLDVATPTADDPLALQRRRANLDGVEVVEQASIAGGGPESAVQRLLFAMLDPPLDDTRVRELFARRAFEGDSDADEETIRELTEGLSVFARSARRAEVPMAMVRDSILSSTRFEVSGDPQVGFRVVGRVVSGTGRRESVWFVVKARGGYRVRASEGSPAAIGEEALALLEQGKIRAGRRWLEWAAEAFGPGRGGAPLETPPFFVLRAERAPAIAQAAALVAMGPRASRARRHLERALDAITEGPARVALEKALWTVYARTDAPEKAATVAAQLFDRSPDSPVAFTLHCSSAVQAGQLDEARRVAKARLAEAKDDERALVCLSEVAVAEGDASAARALLMRRVEDGAADPVTLNNVAWLALFTGEVGDEDAAAALRANVMTGFEDPAKLHTLAAVYAELGRIREAHQLFVKRLELRGASEPEHVDGFLLGRILEHLGLDDLAAEAYRGVKPEARAADSTYRLAQARLEAMRVRAEPEAR